MTSALKKKGAHGSRVSSFLCSRKDGHTHTSSTPNFPFLSILAPLLQHCGLPAWCHVAVQETSHCFPTSSPFLTCSVHRSPCTGVDEIDDKIPMGKLQRLVQRLAETGAAEGSSSPPLPLGTQWQESLRWCWNCHKIFQMHFCFLLRWQIARSEACPSLRPPDFWHSAVSVA